MLNLSCQNRLPINIYRINSVSLKNEVLAANMYACRCVFNGP